MPQAPVREAGDADFETAVVARSREVPVVVDFWAAWCGPCRVIGPMLEKLAAQGAGAWDLVKVDVDKNPKLAGAFRIRSIPAVKAFRDGKVVSEFVGALPEAQIRSWLGTVLPTEADRRVAAAEAKRLAGDLPGAELDLRAALADDVDHARAIVALAGLLADRGTPEADGEAIALLDRRPLDTATQAVRARIAVRRSAGDVHALAARVAADVADVAARYDLGRALAAAGRYDEALEHLLEVVRRDRKLDDDGARRAMLDVFRVLGDDDERTRRFRRALAMAI
jgi:putative thioredoxin